jgi:cell division protein FtsQ
MQPKKKIYIALKIVIPLLVFFVSIGFVGKKQDNKLCSKIIIKIENQQGNFFINEGDIMDIITNNGKELIVNMPFETIELKAIEARIEQLKFVESAEVYRDLSGVMMVDAKQAKPIARIINPTGKDHYISDMAEIIPVSDRFTARVMVLSGSFFRPYLKSNLLVDDSGTELFDFIKFIEKDKFWSAQFAQLDVDSKGMINIYPQVTKQLIEFGSAEHYLDKLSRLKIFYDKILPDRGWNRYERVNLQFKDQIICE